MPVGLRKKQNICLRNGTTLRNIFLNFNSCSINENKFPLTTVVLSTSTCFHYSLLCLVITVVQMFSEIAALLLHLRPFSITKSMYIIFDEKICSICCAINSDLTLHASVSVCLCITILLFVYIALCRASWPINESKVLFYSMLHSARLGIGVLTRRSEFCKEVF